MTNIAKHRQQKFKRKIKVPFFKQNYEKYRSVDLIQNTRQWGNLLLAE